jgi:hypothetical protein
MIYWTLRLKRKLSLFAKYEKARIKAIALCVEMVYGRHLF